MTTSSSFWILKELGVPVRLSIHPALPGAVQVWPWPSEITNRNASHSWVVSIRVINCVVPPQAECWAGDAVIKIPVSSLIGSPDPVPIHNIRVGPGVLMAINLLVCALPFNTHPQTHCLTKFAKCIFWLQHFYLGKMPELSASKDFSPFLANLPKKHQRELLIFSLVLIQLISPHFLSFLLRKLTFNKSDSYQVPATCQHQHRSQYEL